MTPKYRVASPLVAASCWMNFVFGLDGDSRALYCVFSIMITNTCFKPGERHCEAPWVG